MSSGLTTWLDLARNGFVHTYRHVEQPDCAWAWPPPAWRGTGWARAAAVAPTGDGEVALARLLRDGVLGLLAGGPVGMQGGVHMVHSKNGPG